MSKPEMIFVGIDSTLNKPGKKLTKSLFKQIEEEVCFDGDEVIGWVNYYWKGCYKDDDGEVNSSGYFVCYGGEEKGEYHLHVLWKNKKGEYRRCLVGTNWPEYLLAKEKGQLFLGDFCF
jgi:hypothetical protein